MSCGLVFLFSLGLLVSGSSDQELRGHRWDETSGIVVVVVESQGLTAAGEVSRPVGGRCLSRTSCWWSTPRRESRYDSYSYIFSFD